MFAPFIGSVPIFLVKLFLYAYCGILILILYRRLTVDLQKITFEIPASRNFHGDIGGDAAGLAWYVKFLNIVILVGVQHGNNLRWKCNSSHD